MRRARVPLASPPCRTSIRAGRASNRILVAASECGSGASVTLRPSRLRLLVSQKEYHVLEILTLAVAPVPIGPWLETGVASTAESRHQKCLGLRESEWSRKPGRYSHR